MCCYSNKKKCRAIKTDPQVGVFVTKPDDPSSIPKCNVIEEIQLPQTHTKINKINVIKI